MKLIIEDLVKRARKGDPKAWYELHEKYASRVFRFARSRFSNDSLAEEIAQEAWVRAYKNIDKLDHGNFIGWILTIARNIGINRGNRRANQMLPIQHFEDQVFVEKCELDPRALALRECLEELVQRTKKEKSRKIISMYYYDALKQTEIESTLEIPAGTVASRLGRARSALIDCVLRKTT